MAARTTPSTSLQDTERIVRVCSPCNQFTAAPPVCRPASVGQRIFLKVFDDGRRCRPRDFLARYLRRHVASRYPGFRVNETDDVASRIVVELFETPPARPLAPPDLTGLRRFLASRAIQRVVDDIRTREGRLRCGNCRYHQQLKDRGRHCHHPSPDHPWAGKEVRGAVNPKEFDPPCQSFVSRRTTDPLDDDAPVAAPTDDDPRAQAMRNELRHVVLDAMLALQKDDPRVAYAVHQAVVANKENDEIAQQLQCSVKTVIRYKQKGLAILQEELAARGIGR